MIAHAGPGEEESRKSSKSLRCLQPAASRRIIASSSQTYVASSLTESCPTKESLAAGSAWLGSFAEQRYISRTLDSSTKLSSINCEHLPDSPKAKIAWSAF